MPQIWPCRGCPLRDGCELREEFKKRAAGTGAVTIGYRCSRLATEIRVGRRIVITAPIFAGIDWEGQRDMTRREVRAVINGVQNRYQFSCVVEPGQINPSEMSESVDPDRVRFRRTQKHTRIVRFLDEPDKELCEFRNATWGGKCDTNDGNCICASNAAVMRECAPDHRRDRAL